jgi:putative DNA primase/helicase
MTMLDMASSYVKVGFKVFPAFSIQNGACTCGGEGCSAGKHPIGFLAPRGVRDATGDINVVEGWWTQVPNANIGIATGKKSNLVVLDVDGPAGEETLAKLERKFGSLPPTCRVETGKGKHIYFRYPENIAKVKSVARKKLGLDVRGDGGYVIAPPSAHESGRRYTFSEDTASELAPCPEWVTSYANGELTIDDPAAGTTIDGSTAKKPLPALPARFRDRPVDNSLGAGISSRAKTENAPTTYSEKEEARLRSALASIPADDRDTWRDMGAALHSLGWGDKGFEIWTCWSQTHPKKYDEADQQKTWASFDRPYTGVRITAATIFYRARERGWIDQMHPLDLHTDLGNARRFIKRHGKSIHFIPEWRKWVVWNGSRWDIDNDGAAMRLAKDTVEAMYEEASKLASSAQRDALLKHAIRSQAEARLKAMVSLAESEDSAVLAAHKLDADPWLLGVQNGVVNLKTGQFRPARQEDLITKRAAVAFDDAAKCPEWLKFLATVTGGDADLQSYLQRIVGYTLTGSVREEVLFVLYGTGSNGKSTFRETVHSLLGNYALAADAGLLIERKTPGGATPELARLKGRRLISINETSENDHLNEARVKFITSQDKITARNLYQDFFDFDPSHKTFLTTNHKPIIRGTDIGIWRRIHLLPFTVAIRADKVEKDFRERRLMPELPGILNWALAGLASYREQGLNPPVTVLASTEEYRADMDVVGQWIAERCEQDPKARVPTSLAYNDYFRWAEEEVGWALKKLTFRRHLSDRGFGAVKGTHGQRAIQGLRLKTTGAAAFTAARVREPSEVELLAKPRRSGDLPGTGVSL